MNVYKVDYIVFSDVGADRWHKSEEYAYVIATVPEMARRILLENEPVVKNTLGQTIRSTVVTWIKKQDITPEEIRATDQRVLKD